MSSAETPISLRLYNTVVRHRLPAALIAHAFLFGFALFGAFGMYFNFKLFRAWFQPFFLPMLPLVIVVKTLVFWRMGLLTRGWRYFGLRDCMAVVVASWVSTAAFILVSFAIEYYHRYFGALGDSYLYVYARDAAGTLLTQLNDQGQPLYDDRGNPLWKILYQFPQSVFPLDWGLTIAAVCGPRILARLYYEETRPVATGGAKNCLIIGAGDTGEMLLRELLRTPVQEYRVVGFLDDNPSKSRTRIHDVPVVGGTQQVRELCERLGVQDILIADPKLGRNDLRRMVELCGDAKVRFQKIPAMEEVVAGRVTVSQVRDVDIKDLLGREQVRLDEAGLRAFLQGKRVLVTGAGGSIGSEICRQVCSYLPERLIMVEQAENNLFEIDRELLAAHPTVQRVCCIADICDERRVESILECNKPHVVFHAAAHKHVPMMEINVGEAIKNNVKGTKTIADAAKRHGVGRFVMISTDKAVNPTSVMGCTKRVAEMYIQQLGQGATTQYMTVRFGNVLGSSGSVVPIFHKQIAEGGPVTVTHPEMTRYFMTIPEATQLVLQAGVIGTDGDIFVLDMGEPVKIVDLAREMITLSGLRPGEDIEIAFTGMRPGEKLFEELSIRGEDMSKTRHEQIYVWRNRKEDWDFVRREIDLLTASADSAAPGGLRDHLCRIVPEYQPETGITSGARIDVAGLEPARATVSNGADLAESR